MEDELIIFICLLGAAMGGQCIQRRRRPRRRWAVRPINQRRRQQGDYHNLIQEMRLGDQEMFFVYTRMTPNRFDLLLSLVGPSLKKNSNCESLPPGLRLAVALRILATGGCLLSIALSFRIGKSTCCEVINETTLILWNTLHQKYLPEPSEADYLYVAEGFKNRWNLPNCVGAIDGKHVVIQAPPNTGAQYHNYKGQFSIVLLAVCDHNYKFTHVDIGAYGSQSDGGIFRLSEFGRRLNDGSLPLPPPAPLPSTDVPFPFFIVGDEAFALEHNVMRPYPGKNLSKIKQVYNYRMSRGRRNIENAFGIMVARWRVFHKVIIADPENVDNIIKAAVCLHNFLKKLDEESRIQSYCNAAFSDRETDGQIFPGEWRAEPSSDQGTLQPIGTLQRRLGSRNTTQNAAALRDHLANYMYSPIGAVDWQMAYVNRGTDVADQ